MKKKILLFWAIVFSSLYYPISMYGQVRSLSEGSENDLSDSIVYFAPLTTGRQTQADLLEVKRINDSIKAAESKADVSQSTGQKAISSLAATLAAVQLRGVVGEIPMTKGTTPSGGMSLNIPIDCYAGRGNAKPSISLCYNSQESNDILGNGWLLGGISKICSVSKSLYYDNVAQAPYGSVSQSDDALELDGIRLVHQGNGYVTVQGNIKVMGILDASSNFSGFTAYYPDGSQCTYVLTGVKEYSISMYKDRNGNMIHFSYTTVSGSSGLPSVITYHNGKARIEFSYINRPDSISAYKYGQVSNERRLLKTICCYLSGEALRTYTLNYGVQQNVSVLLSISCANAGNGLARPVTFQYGTENNSTAYSSTYVQAIEWYNFSDPSLVVTKKGKVGWGSDVQDDGLVHYPYQYPFYCARSQHGLGSNKYYYNNNYTGDEKIYIYSGLDQTGSSGSIQFTDPMPSITTEEGFVDLLFADVDKLPGEELVKVNSVVENDHDVLYFTVYANSGTTGLTRLYKRRFDMGVADIYYKNYRRSVWPREFSAIDMDGDGQMEIFAVSTNQPLYYSEKKSRCWVFNLEDSSIKVDQQAFEYDMSLAGHIVPAEPDQLYTMDFNRDGKTEVLMVDDKGMNFYEFKGNVLQLKQTTPLMTRSDFQSDPPVWGDWNGDGYIDFIKWKGDKKGFYAGKGDGTFTKISVDIPLLGNETWSIQSQDINGDNHSDLIYSKYDSGTDKTVAMVYLWNQNNGFTKCGDDLSWDKNGILIPTNIKSNNYYNRISYLKDGKIWVSTLHRNDMLERSMSRSETSLGVADTYTYAQLTGSDGIYSSQYVDKEKFPFTAYRGNLFVLQDQQTLLKGQKIDENKYSYDNAVVHQQGLGFCGFQGIRANDPVTGEWSVQNFDPFNFETPTSIENIKSRTDINYSIRVDDNKRRHVLLIKQVDADKTKDTKVQTLFGYDDRDYLVSKKMDYGNNITDSVNTTNNYIDNEDQYILGVPVSVADRSSRGQLSWEKRRAYVYDAKFNPTKEQSFVNGQSEEEKTYTYDDAGNTLTKSIREYDSTGFLTYKYEYDDLGRVTKEYDALGLPTSYTYDTEGEVATSTDHKGRVTKYSYDGWRRVSKKNNPDNTFVSYATRWATHPTAELVAYVMMQEGSSDVKTENTYYDGLKRDIVSSVTRFNDKESNVLKEYDTNGRLSRISQPYFVTPSLWTSYQYDTYDRTVGVTQPTGEQESYSYSKTSVTETKKGVTSTKTYDSATGKLLTASDQGGTISYVLRADGQASSAVASGGVTTNFEYDNYGRQTAIHDPSAGNITYNDTYIGDNKVRTVVDARGQKTVSTYDKYGRINKIEQPEFTTNYIYASDGLLTGKTASNGTSVQYSYDNQDRISTFTESVKGKKLVKSYTYLDGQIDSESITTPYSSENIELDYTYGNGFLTQVSLEGKDDPISMLSSENELGQPTVVQTGGIERTYSYTACGMPLSWKAGKVQNFTYQFNEQTGNLTSRTDNVYAKTEQFTYDGMNRLTGINGNAVEYADNGNITKMPGIGEMSYEMTSKPYAVSGFTAQEGYSLPGAQTLVYNSMERPQSIIDGSYQATFDYNDQGERTYMYVAKGGAREQTTYYLGGNYEGREDKNGNVTEMLYLDGDAYSASSVYVKKDGSWNIYYICRDYLGSITQICNEDGSLKQELSYDAWGRLRNPQTQEIYKTGEEPELFLARGYTGHEHLVWCGLINMNARLYDPAIGRFLSPDPFVQMPDFTQNFNRYSYCLNNPLAYNDQSGEFFGLITGFIKGFVKMIHGGKWYYPFKYSAKGASNDLKLLGGFFIGSPKQILSRFTWESIQTVVGYVWSSLGNDFFNVDDVEYFDGATFAIDEGVRNRNQKGLTLGSYIKISFSGNTPRDKEGHFAPQQELLFMHEYGHYLQSQGMGPAYLFRVGIPSILTAMKNKNVTAHFENGDDTRGKSLYYKWYEVDANKRGHDYFLKYHSVGMPDWKESIEHYPWINPDKFL